MEPLQFFRTPVRKISGLSLALADGLFVAGHGLYVIRNCALLADIGVAEAQYGLMSACSDAFKKFVDGSPVVVVLPLADIIVKHI